MRPRTVKFWIKRRWWWLFLGLLVVTSIIWLRRFPDNFYAPNFYAEDGTIFAENIYRFGVWRSFLIRFNGYYVWGMYLLEAIGMAANRLFWGGEFVTLPAALAAVSYGFMGLCVTLPVVIFRKYLPAAVLVWLALISAFVPMPGSDYAVIGTIGNLKFLYVYVAFLLLGARHWLPASSRWVWLVDLGILVCAYTNITVYALAPFALLRYRHLLSRKLKVTLKKAWTDHSFRSVVILGLFMGLQLVLIRHYGLPETPGYLDAPYQWKATIEMFAGRTYLYGLLFWGWRFMSDWLALGLTAVLVVGSVWLAPRQLKSVTVLGIYTAFMMTFLFVVKRTGLSELYTGYKGSGPDQFFYAQNVVVYCIVAFALTGLWQRLKAWQMRAGLVVMVTVSLVAMPALVRRGYGNLGFKDKVGTIRASAHEACRENDNQVAVVVYPDERFTVDLPKNLVCTPETANYQPGLVRTGLAPYQNNYLSIAGAEVRQTFTATQDNLKGVNVYFSTFAKPVRSSLDLRLYEADCHNLITQTKIRDALLLDNQYFAVTFKPIGNSKDKQYCLALNSSPTPPVAIQLSAPDQYAGGAVLAGNQVKNEDMVFDLLYEEHR